MREFLARWRRLLDWTRLKPPIAFHDMLMRHIDGVVAWVNKYADQRISFSEPGTSTHGHQLQWQFQTDRGIAPAHPLPARRPRCDVLIEELELGEIRGGLPMARSAPCDAVEVERYCAENDIAFEWAAYCLSTRQVAAATETHPVSGEKVCRSAMAHRHHPVLSPRDASRDGRAGSSGREGSR